MADFPIFYAHKFYDDEYITCEQGDPYGLGSI
jgi:hypothetical protein